MQKAVPKVAGTNNFRIVEWYPKFLLTAETNSLALAFDIFDPKSS